jgi:opacity protein-like surface antigen
MTSRIVRAFVVSVCTFAVATPALAQAGGAQPAMPSAHIAPGQWALDGSIGFAVPVGDFGTGLNTGLDVMGAVEYRPAATGHVYFRGEIGYSDFGYSGISGSSGVWRFAANGLYDFDTHSPLQVYGLAGIGIYHVSWTADLCGVAPFYSCTESSTGFGINLGAGVRYPVNPVQLFFEVRYQVSFAAPFSLGSAPYFPFQFGVRYLLPK